MRSLITPIASLFLFADDAVVAIPLNNIQLVTISKSQAELSDHQA